MNTDSNDESSAPLTRSYEGSRLFVREIGCLHIVSGVALLLVSPAFMIPYTGEEAGSFGLLDVLYPVFIVAVVFNVLTGASIGSVVALNFETPVLPLLIIAFALMQIWAGRGLHRYNPTAKPVILAICPPGLIMFPFGTAVASFTLYELMSATNAHLFTPEFDPDIDDGRDPEYNARMIALCIGIILCGAAGYSLLYSI